MTHVHIAATSGACMTELQAGEGRVASFQVFLPNVHWQGILMQSSTVHCVLLKNLRRNVTQARSKFWKTNRMFMLNVL